MLNLPFIYVVLFFEVFVSKLRIDLLVDLNTIVEEREDCVALIVAENRLWVDVADRLALLDLHMDVVHLVKIKLRVGAIHPA